MTDRQQKAIREMKKQGIALGVIASELGLSTNTIKSYCRRNNLGNFDAPEAINTDRCKNCGTLLRHLPRSKKKTFCNDRCRYSWWNKNRPYIRNKPIHHLTCFHCGSEFKTNNKKRKYCSRECYIQSRFGEGLP